MNKIASILIIDLLVGFKIFSQSPLDGGYCLIMAGGLGRLK